MGQCATHTHKRQHPRATEISARTTRINFKSQRELETQISNLNVNFTRKYYCNVRHTFTNMKHARATEISAQTTRVNLKPPTRINLKPPRDQALAIPPFGCHQALSPNQGAESSSGPTRAHRRLTLRLAKNCSGNDAVSYYTSFYPTTDQQELPTNIVVQPVSDISSTKHPT